MNKYCFADGPVLIKAGQKANPQRIGEALAKITKAGNGRLTPAAVVEAAKEPRSPLHRHFEWDDAKAADAYRLDQAREIIRIVRIESDEHDEPPRAFLSISDRGGTAYHELGEVMGNRSLQAAVLAQAERDLESFQRRYRDLQEICAAVGEVRELVAVKRSQMGVAA